MSRKVPKPAWLRRYDVEGLKSFFGGIVTEVELRVGLTYKYGLKRRIVFLRGYAGDEGRGTRGEERSCK
jgi:hypothetical protein